MDDNLIVWIATIQAIVMSQLFTGASLGLQINGQRTDGTGLQVSFLLLLWE